MKTIKIFLASSEELKEERLEMTDLMSRLNQTFKGRGIELELKRWEYLDASMGVKRKQDEYNEVLKDCDICLVMFWRKLGSYTGEELDVAYQCHKDKVRPEKIYVFFKNPDGDDVTDELKEFIWNYESRYGGHFFCKFQTVDAMKLEFLLQFELYQKDQLGSQAIEVRNEHVYIDNEAFVDLNNIPFAANNEGYKKLQSELKELHEEIADMQAKLEKKNKKLERKKADYDENPDDEDCLEDYKDAKEDVDRLTDDLQKRLNRKNALEKEFEREQQNLFNTARRITEQRGQKISERMARAIEAFERGDAQRADVILDEAEKDFEAVREDFRLTKKVSVQALEEQIQRASYKMSNTSILIDERIAKTLEIYEEADAFAQEINYDQEKYIEFLFDYAAFLEKYAKYSRAIESYNRLMKLCEVFYGKEHPDTAKSYSGLGVAYYYVGDYDKALVYYQQALDIRVKVLGKDHPDTAQSFNNIGRVYNSIGCYDRALDYFQQALDIYKVVLGKEHPDTAISYNCIGKIYAEYNDYDKALDYHQHALNIFKEVLGKEHPNTAYSYDNIGVIYANLGNYDKAKEYNQQALAIREKVLGKNHPNTAISFSNVGAVYFNLGDYDKALEYCFKNLAISEDVLGTEHPDTAKSYNDIGAVYHYKGDYDKALEYYFKALAIYEKVLGSEHPATRAIKENIEYIKSKMN